MWTLYPSQWSTIQCTKYHVDVKNSWRCKHADVVVCCNYGSVYWHVFNRQVHQHRLCISCVVRQCHRYFCVVAVARIDGGYKKCTESQKRDRLNTNVNSIGLMIAQFWQPIVLCTACILPHLASDIQPSECALVVVTEFFLNWNSSLFHPQLWKIFLLKLSKAREMLILVTCKLQVAISALLTTLTRRHRSFLLLSRLKTPLSQGWMHLVRIVLFHHHQISLLVYLVYRFGCGFHAQLWKRTGRCFRVWSVLGSWSESWGATTGRISRSDIYLKQLSQCLLHVTNNWRYRGLKRQKEI